ncbi:MAG: zinc-ribbon domain-containing protein [Paenacidovorax caeni]
MSQITCCPSCGTKFKVVADQLRISEGWVRCGQCKEIFDASAHMQAIVVSPLLPDLPLEGPPAHDAPRLPHTSPSPPCWRFPIR